MRCCLLGIFFFLSLSQVAGATCAHLAKIGKESFLYTVESGMFPLLALPKLATALKPRASDEDRIYLNALVRWVQERNIARRYDVRLSPLLVRRAFRNINEYERKHGKVFPYQWDNIAARRENRSKQQNKQLRNRAEQKDQETLESVARKVKHRDWVKQNARRWLLTRAIGFVGMVLLSEAVSYLDSDAFDSQIDPPDPELALNPLVVIVNAYPQGPAHEEVNRRFEARHGDSPQYYHLIIATDPKTLYPKLEKLKNEMGRKITRLEIQSYDERDLRKNESDFLGVLSQTETYGPHPTPVPDVMEKKAQLILKQGSLEEESLEKIAQVHLKHGGTAYGTKYVDWAVPKKTQNIGKAFAYVVPGLFLAGKLLFVDQHWERIQARFRDKGLRKVHVPQTESHTDVGSIEK